MPPAARVHALVRGRVQGVGFRWFVVEAAGALALTGIVRNLPTRDVEIVAEGGHAEIERLLNRVREGPPGARVEAVDVEWETPRGRYDTFRAVG